MVELKNYQRAIVVCWTKLIILVVLSAYMTCGIAYVGISHVNQFFIIGHFVTLIVEVGMWILLYKAIKQRSFTKSRLWIILSIAFFCILSIIFIVDTSSGWNSDDTILLIAILFEIISFYIIYNFMTEIRNSSSRPRPNLTTPVSSSASPITPSTVRLNTVGLNTITNSQHPIFVY